MMINNNYYLENGRVVFTEKFHLERGYCCNSVGGCRHCPYKNKSNEDTKRTIHDTKGGETKHELRQGDIDG